MQVEGGTNLCRMWLGSPPSGDGKIVAIRRVLLDTVFGPGRLCEFMRSEPFTIPSIVHWYDGFTSDADTIWVGEARCTAELSP